MHARRDILDESSVANSSWQSLEFDLMNSPDVEKNWAEMDEECIQKYGIARLKRPAGLDVQREIEAELNKIRQLRKEQVKRELQENRATLVDHGDGIPTKKPMEIRLARHTFGIPSLSISQRQVQQITQNAQQGVKQFSSAIRNPAVHAQVLNSVRSSAQRIPKLHRVAV